MALARSPKAAEVSKWQLPMRYLVARPGNTGKAVVMKKQKWQKRQNLARTEIFETGYLYHYQYYLYYQIHLLFIDPPTLRLSRYTSNKSDPM